MDGYLLVPPERSALIGKSGWKTRYVTLGTVQQRFEADPPRPELPRTFSASKLLNARKDLRAASALASATDLSIAHPEKLWLAVFKQKGDAEPISNNAVSTIKSCEIQSIQFRKSDPAVSTLVITFEVDKAADKVRKRRSSRAGVLQAPTSAFPNSLLFRTVPEETYNIYDWQVTIQPRIQPNTPDFADEADPGFTAFKNPFVKSGERPHISKPILRPEPFHRHSNTKDFGPNRPTTSSLISPSPSLRSHRSDLSSQSSFLARPQGYSGNSHLPIQHPPTELPSPASTFGHDEQFITGWTAAQGRTSALSTHTRACSVSTTSTPPIVRETILDRAFNLNYIPGSDRLPAPDAGEGAMSSIARFEALMLEHERRKKAADASRPSTKEKDAWSLAEEGDSETDCSAPPSRRAGDVRQNFFDEETAGEEDVEALEEIPLRAQRALEYIMSGRSGAASASRPRSARRKSQAGGGYKAVAAQGGNAPVPLPQLQSRRQRPMSFSHTHSRKTSQQEVDHGLGAQQQHSLSPSYNSGNNNSLNRQSGKWDDPAGLKRGSGGSGSDVLLVQTQSRHSGVSSAASTYGEEEEKENVGEGLGRGLGTSRLSGLGLGQGGGRPGMGMRRSTVAGAAEVERESRRWGFDDGGGAGGLRERDAEGERRESRWRGSGVCIGAGEGGFL